MPRGSTAGPYIAEWTAFSWVLSGYADVSGSWGHLRLRPGFLHLEPAGRDDFWQYSESQITRTVSVEFEIESDLGPLGAPTEWPIVAPMSQGGILFALSDYLRWYITENADANSEVLEAAASLLLRLFVLGPAPRESEQPPLPESVERAVNEVRRRWSGQTIRPISLGDLAAATAVSPGHLSRSFREHFGLSAVAAFERVRLAWAARLLIRTNLTVEAIGGHAGFADLYHFSRRFRAVMGVSPRTYRRQPDQRTDVLAFGRLAELERLIRPAEAPRDDHPSP